MLKSQITLRLVATGVAASKLEATCRPKQRVLNVDWSDQMQLVEANGWSQTQPTSGERWGAPWTRHQFTTGLCVNV